MIVSSASEIADCAKRFLTEHAAANGIGPDAYCEAEQRHPMADAKFLSAVAELHATRLLSVTTFKAFVEPALERLEETAIEFGDGGLAWGLGFSWRGMPGSEPYLITTALVSRGLIDVARVGYDSVKLQEIKSRALRAIALWHSNLNIPVNGWDVRVPLYSPGIGQAVFNPAAYSSATLLLAETEHPEPWSPEDWCKLLAKIFDSRRPGIGWPYSVANPIVDLVHQCYLLNGMLDALNVEVIEPVALEVVGQFCGIDGFVDSFRLLGREMSVPVDAKALLYRCAGGEWIYAQPKKARLWSLGELLVVTSRLAAIGRHTGYWTHMSRWIAHLIAARFDSDDVEILYPRHRMHSAHGLASLLGHLRRLAAGAKS